MIMSDFPQTYYDVMLHCGIVFITIALWANAKFLNLIALGIFPNYYIKQCHLKSTGLTTINISF